MSKRSGYPITEQRGIVLVLSLLVMTILSVLALAFLSTAQTEDAIAVNYRNHPAAFYAAEAGLESGVSSLKSLLGATPTPTDAQLTALAPPALTDPTYTFDAFQVARVRTVPPYNYQTTLTTGAYAGLNAITTDYVVTATARGPRGSRAQVSQTIRHVAIPLFQFGAFYGKGVDFEVYAGPTFTFDGRVHANSDIYLADSGSNGMFYDSYMTAVGNFYRHRKDKACCTRQGNPDIKDGGGAYQSLDFDREVKNISADGSTWEAGDVDYWRSEALSRFGGKVQDSAMGVQEIIPPIPDALYDPDNADVSSHLMIEKGSAGDSADLKAAKLYYQADLIIGEEKGYDQAGNEIDLSTCKDAEDTKAVRKEKFYDGREKVEMEVTQIDVGALTACGLMPANGILYATAKESGGKKEDGIRLVNGAELPSQGLTVVSENPVYVQGDYNTVNKVPAAVMGDAITVLSNNWGPNDYDKESKDTKDKTWSRPAAETTVNAAFAMGPHAEAKPGAGNGEFNNVIRFLEDWNNVNFNYKGSVVALWHSQQATTPWRCCGDDGDNYYVPPIRNWGYDTLFDTNPPPGAPIGTIITRGQWSEG
ncbi:MAG: PilX N-terminal domain-containing pilus assembly protein [candidate division NC10 bacterium]